jgi:MOSC domain-containing protein YiiM
MRGKGIELSYGDFAENITTRGVDLAALPLGTRLWLGEAELEVTQIGKECHQGCAIFQAVGDCVMPRRGIFARVLKGGMISRESSGHYRIG